MADDFRAALAEFEERLDRKLDSRFGALDSRFGALDSRFGALERRFEALEGRFPAIDDRFTSIDHRFVAMERRIDESAAETRNFARVLTEAVRDDVKRVADGVIAANEGLNALRRDVATLDNKVGRIELKLLLVTSASTRRLKRRR